jgi:protein-S-isoprenylcysteine O-methyltransferase Ste14
VNREFRVLQAAGYTRYRKKERRNSEKTQKGKAQGKFRMKPILKKAIGVILIIVGLAALVTPFTPGSWLALIGLQLVGLGFLVENRLGRALKNRCKNSFESLKRKVRQISHRKQPPSQTKGPQ